MTLPRLLVAMAAGAAGLLTAVLPAVAQISLSPPTPAPASRATSPAPKAAPANKPAVMPPARPHQANAAPKVAGPAPAPAAQQGPANALQGFSQNRDQPVKIGANSLELREKDKMATFTGNVQLVQGDTVLKCASLQVYYEDDKSNASKSTGSMTMVGTDGGAQRIRRVEAKGGVQVTQKDQTANGDNGVFDMLSNTVTLHGNVTVVRGQDVLRGQQLVVDLTTGVSRMEAGASSGGRVEGMFRAGGNGSGAAPTLRDVGKPRN